MDDRQLLWGLYQDVIAQGRHHETQRLGMTNAVLVVAAALLGLIGVDEKVSDPDIPAGAFLVAVGIVGWVFSLKQYERFQYHMEFAAQYRSALAVEHLRALRKDAKREHEENWSEGWRKTVEATRLHWWWASLHLVVSALGIAILAVAIF